MEGAIPAGPVAAVAVLVLLCLSFALPAAARAVRVLSRRAAALAGWADRRAGVARRYPRVAAFVVRRFDPSEPAGLVLTILILGAGYALMLTGGLVEELFESDELAAIDKAIFAVLDRFRSPEAVSFFTVVTRFGNTEALIGMVVVATGFLLAHGPRRYVLPMWIVIAGAQITTWAGKYVLARPRPDFIYDVSAASPSFPSAHAAGATAIYGIVAYVIARELPYGMRIQLAYWTIVAIGLVGLSRMVLNVHYASDVAAGHLVGVIWLLTGIAIAELGRRER